MRVIVPTSADGLDQDLQVCLGMRPEVDVLLLIGSGVCFENKTQHFAVCLWRLREYRWGLGVTQ